MFEEEFEKNADKSNIGNMKHAMHTSDPAAIVLSGAEGDFPTPSFLRKALADFAMRGSYGFTLADDPYLEHILWWFDHVRNLSVSAEEIVPAQGTVFAASTAIRTFTFPNDGIIFQRPSYYRLERAAVRNGRRIVTNPMTEENGIYSVDFKDLEKKMAMPENRMLVLVNPHNPTGKVFTAAELEHIVFLAEKYDVLIFCDEIFAESAQTEMRSVRSFSSSCIVSTSLGKSFHLTGVNQANLIIPNKAIRGRFLSQRDADHFGSIDPFFYTALLSSYTPQGKQWVQEANIHYRNNYNLLARQLPVVLSPLQGTFTAWIDLRQTNGEALMKQAGIIADPGWEYGEEGNGFFRWNLAVTSQTMRTAADRLRQALAEKKYSLSEE